MLFVILFGMLMCGSDVLIMVNVVGFFSGDVGVVLWCRLIVWIVLL